MLTRFIFCLFFILCVPLTAGFEDHLKRVSDKHEVSQMRNIDFIYLINLDERPEKREHCVRELSPYGIYPHRFSAVNGWELSLEAINDVGYRFQGEVGKGLMATYYPLDGGGDPSHEPMQVPGRTYFGHCTPRGAIGIVLSHLSLLKDAYESGYETIWIMEDDIKVHQNPHLLSDRIDELNRLVGKRKWDILFTDPDTKDNSGRYIPCYSAAWRPFCSVNLSRFAKRKVINQHFQKIGARYGAYSYIINREGMKKLLTFFREKSLFLPYDMEYTLPAGIQLYSLREDLVSTYPAAPSDNGGRGINTTDWKGAMQTE